MLFLLSGHVFLHGRAHAAYSEQDSCLPCIMCPLRAPSGRWRPPRALGIHRGSHHYGKVCKHMVLNRDVKRFSLNVPPTRRIWLKCNEGRKVAWQSLLSCYWLSGCWCHTEIHLLCGKGMSWNMTADEGTYERFSQVMQWKHWIWCYFLIYSLVFRVWGRVAMLYYTCSKQPDATWNMKFSLFRSSGIGSRIGPRNGRHPYQDSVTCTNKLNNTNFQIYFDEL